MIHTTIQIESPQVSDIDFFAITLASIPVFIAFGPLFGWMIERRSVPRC